MLKTAINNLFGIEYPIIQGGMAHLATAELVSAVSNAGGLGTIAAAGYDTLWLRQQIRKTQELTIYPFGVNLYLPSPRIIEQIEVILDEKVSIVVLAAGNPMSLMEKLKNRKIKIIPVISDVKQVRILDQSGISAIIAEGSEAGGHIGKIPILRLLKQVVNEVQVPVIAAGGIGDKRGMQAALDAGADGVQMGTRFICSDECIAHPNFKARIIDAKSTDTLVIGGSTGNRIRCLSNSFTQNYLELEKLGATREELEYFIRNRLYLGVVEGNMEEGLLMAGQSVNLIKDIKPVKSILENMVS